MFQIFVVVVALATGEVTPLASSETYPTQEACDAAMPARVASLKAYLEAHGSGEIAIQSKCMVDGKPA